MLALLLPLLCAPMAQETPAQTPATEKEAPAKKKKFPRLTSPMKKDVQAGMHLLEKGKDEEKVEAGVQQILAVGEAAIPACLNAAKRMEKADRLPPLWKVLDTLLQDDDLELAWSLLKKNAPDCLRIHLLRRWADSERKDTEEMLATYLSSEHADFAYEAARGLAFRGHPEAISAIELQVRSHWLKDSSRLRQDFANIDRAPLVSSILPLLERKRSKEKLAAVRMFELFGVPEHANKLLPFLAESDTSLRLAAINACRVVVDQKEPLDHPSMTEIIERGEAWKARL